MTSKEKGKARDTFGHFQEPTTHIDTYAIHIKSKGCFMEGRKKVK